MTTVNKDGHIRYTKPFLRLKAQALSLVGGTYPNALLWHEAETESSIEKAIEWTPSAKMPIDYTAYVGDRVNWEKRGRIKFNIPGTYLVRGSWAVDTSATDFVSRTIHA